MTDLQGTQHDLTRLIAQGEGQYLEFKSALQGPPGDKKARATNEVRDDISECVAAFANADGGTMLVGVEDDGSITGHHYPEAKVEIMLAVPQQRLKPQQPRGKLIEVQGKQVLVFEVPPAELAVMVTGNGFPRRIGDEVILESEASINAIKARARTDSIESESQPAAQLQQLDPELILRAKTAAGLASLSDVDYLIARRLADLRGNHLVLRTAALLLFASKPEFVPFPNAGVRVLAVRGTTRKTGANLNTVELARIEGALATVLQSTYEVLGQRIRRSVKLHDLFFREMPEYPTFAWQEALVNAVAHRDYRVHGRGVEVWLFDDRMEVHSPGLLLPSIPLASLQQRRPTHESRNPRIARVLAELGMMREQGEGIPRMFEEMERSLLRLPELSSEHATFTVVLRNEPIFESVDPEWVRYVEKLPIVDRQRRALVAFRNRSFSSADYQDINRVDRDEAYRELSELVEQRLLAPPGKRGRGAVYRVLGPGEPVVKQRPEEMLAMRLRQQGFIRNADYREAFGVGREKAKADLADLVAHGVLSLTGAKRGSSYSSGPAFPAWIEARAKHP